MPGRSPWAAWASAVGCLRVVPLCAPAGGHRSRRCVPAGLGLRGGVGGVQGPMGRGAEASGPHCDWGSGRGQLGGGVAGWSGTGSTLGGCLQLCWREVGQNVPERAHDPESLPCKPISSVRRATTTPGQMPRCPVFVRRPFSPDSQPPSFVPVGGAGGRGPRPALRADHETALCVRSGSWLPRPPEGVGLGKPSVSPRPPQEPQGRPPTPRRLGPCSSWPASL